MSTTLSPIVLEACSAASFSQYSLVATIVSILIGRVGLAAVQRLAYSTKWFERSPSRQWKTSWITPAPAGAAAAAGAVVAWADVAGAWVGAAAAAAGVAPPLAGAAPPLLAAAVASVWAGGGAQAARALSPTIPSPASTSERREYSFGRS